MKVKPLNPAKRQSIRVDNFVEYIRLGWDDTRHVLKLSPEQILQLVQLSRKNPEAVRCLLGYAKRFKVAADELTLEDVQQATNSLTVHTILES